MTKSLKAVIPVAGMGTRLLSATKEQPKEMLPIFSHVGGKITVKPIVQVLFEQLFEIGFREFYFIVGRGKRAIEDHFTPDYNFIDLLNKQQKFEYSELMKNFYKKIESSRIIWINQPSPLGFGHAVSLVSHLIKTSDMFLVHAGDTIIHSENHEHIRKMMKVHEDLEASATMLVHYVEDPRQYGVIKGKKRSDEIIHVEHLEEKPITVTSNLAILPVYFFQYSIFDSLNKIQPGKGNEIQLTDGISDLVNSNKKVIALELNPEDMRLDVGMPELYWQALSDSFNRKLDF